MPYGAFSDLTYDSQTGEITASGFTRPRLGGGASIEVIVSSVSGEPWTIRDKVNNPALKDWDVTFTDTPFQEGESVILTALASSDDEKMFTWSQIEPLAPK